MFFFAELPVLVKANLPKPTQNITKSIILTFYILQSQIVPNIAMKYKRNIWIPEMSSFTLPGFCPKNKRYPTQESINKYNIWTPSLCDITFNCFFWSYKWNTSARLLFSSIKYVSLQKIIVKNAIGDWIAEPISS